MSDNLIPPGDEFEDLHERVKYFCGVTNEELLEKLRVVEEKVKNAEWFTRVQDTKERMASLYNENKEFLERFKKSQEEKVANLLEENKELITSIKGKVETLDRSMKQNLSTFDQMMEATVVNAI
jgi:dsDNA-specific endonuclease/ATPase MutS2